MPSDDLRDKLLWPYDHLFPELKRFESYEARKRALHQARNSKTLLWFVPLWAASMIVLIFSPLILRGLVPFAVGFALSAGAAIGTFCFGFYALCQRRMRRQLRLQLRSLGQSVCMHCGYDTHGSEGRCPECGLKFGE